MNQLWKKVRHPFLIVSLLALLLITIHGAQQIRHQSTSENPSPLGTIQPEPSSQVTIGQVPRPKHETHEPSSDSLAIYVVAQNVGNEWGLQAVLAGWNKARYTTIKQTNICPVASVCVVVRENAKINPKFAALTSFYTDHSIIIDLNPAVRENFEAQSSLCHEFGHVLGEGHVKGTHDTCMTAVESYRVLPTQLDLSMVDKLGRWQFDKMFKSSGKTVDVSRLPN